MANPDSIPDPALLSQLEAIQASVDSLNSRYDNLLARAQRLQGDAGAVDPFSAISAWKRTDMGASGTAVTSASQIGVGALLLQGSGIKITRISNSPYLEISSAGALCYDYIVDSSGNGTHTTVRAMVADFLVDATKGTGVKKVCWLCNPDLDAGIELSAGIGNSGVAGSTLIIVGRGADLPNSHDNFTIPYLQITSGVSTVGYFEQTQTYQPNLILIGVGVGATSSPPAPGWIHNTATVGAAIPSKVVLYDCLLALSCPLVASISPWPSQDVYVYRSYGTGTTILSMASIFGTGDVTLNQCQLSLTSIVPDNYNFNHITVTGGKLTFSSHAVQNTTTSGNNYTDVYFSGGCTLVGSTTDPLIWFNDGNAADHRYVITDVRYFGVGPLFSVDRGLGFSTEDVLIDAVYCERTSGTQTYALHVNANNALVGTVLLRGFTGVFDPGGSGTPITTNTAPLTIAGPDAIWNPGLILNDTTPGGTGWMVAHFQRNGTDYASWGLAGGASGPFDVNDFIFSVKEGGTTWVNPFGIQNSSSNVGVDAPLFVTNHYLYVSNAENFTPPANTTPGDLTFMRAFVKNDSNFNLAFAGTIPVITFASGGLYAFDRTVNQHVRYISNSIVELLNASGYLTSGYLNVGSLSAPANTTAGDLTALRLAIGNVAIPTGTLFQLSPSSFVPAGTQYLSYLTGTVAPNNGGTVTVGQQLTMAAAPTVDSATSDVYGLSLQAQHTSGDFALRNLYGLQSNAVKNIAAGTHVLTNMVSYRAVNRPIAGVVTNMYGIEAVQGATGDAGTITTLAGVYVHNGVFGSATTQIGLNIEALTGATTNIAIRTLGGTHRFVGAVNIGADADLPSYSGIGSRLFQITDSATLAPPFGFVSSGQVYDTITINALGAATDILSGFTSGINLTLGATTNAVMRGGFFESILQGGGFTSGEMTGIFGQVTNNDTAVGNALSLGYGVWGNVRAANGTITKAASLHASLQQQAGDAGNIGTWYGLLVDAPGIVPTVASWGAQFGNGLTVGWLDSGGVARNVLRYSTDDFVNMFVPAAAGKKWRIVDQGLTKELLGVDSSGNTNIAGRIVLSAVSSVSANYTVAVTDVTVLGTSGAGGITVTLPDATVSMGRMLWIKKVDVGAGALTIATSPNTQTIDGAATLALATRYMAVLLTSDGSNWFVISQVATTIL